jgi:pilus assembly protein CpaB
MNNDTRTLWISLFAGIFASFLVYSYSQEKQKEYDKKFGALKRVIIAAKDIAEMETIDDTMLDVRSVPEDYVGPAFAGDQSSVIGKVAAAPINKGEQILQTKLLVPGPDTGIALQVSPGKRAVTIPVDEVRGLAKLIRPGDRIDLVAAMDVGKGAASQRVVGYLMQDVPVLATGVNVVNNLPRIVELDTTAQATLTRSLTGDTKFNTVTIEVEPKQAQELVYLISTQPGNLFMVLRNPNDRGRASTTQASNMETVSTNFGALMAAGPQGSVNLNVNVPPPNQTPRQ